jgi:hypothetical protein
MRFRVPACHTFWRNRTRAVESGEDHPEVGGRIRTIFQNVLGLGFWSTCVVTFDFPNDVMYLKKNEHWRRQNDVDLSGLHLVRVDGKVVVFSIDKPTPDAATQLSQRRR